MTAQHAIPTTSTSVANIYHPSIRTIGHRCLLLIALFMMAMGVKAQAPELSTATKRVQYRIQAKNNTEYVIKPIAGNKIDALNSDTNSDDSYWFFEDAGEEKLDDNQVQAYYIRNAKTSAYWYRDLYG